jgi:hypothetical protein
VELHVESQGKPSKVLWQRLGAAAASTLQQGTLSWTEQGKRKWLVVNAYLLARSSTSEVGNTATTLGVAVQFAPMETVRGFENHPLNDPTCSANGAVCRGHQKGQTCGCVLGSASPSMQQHKYGCQNTSLQMFPQPPKPCRLCVGAECSPRHPAHVG